MRLLVCGGRDFTNRKFVNEALDVIHASRGITLVIDGGATGADSLAASWARTAGVLNDTYPADWRKHGRAAGMIRNRQMLKSGKPDLVVAFPGGRGTIGMISIAEKAGIEVKKFTTP
jgi:predicted Rossmann-fold nucleotide-binding protein